MPEKMKALRTLCRPAAVTVGCAAIIAAGTLLFKNRQYYLTALLLLLLAMAMLFFRFERRRPKVSEIVLLSVMTALAVAGRAAFYWLPEFKPVCAIVILTAVAFNAEAGFVVGACAGLVSNFFFGQGPWTPWQMAAFGLVGYFAGLVFYGRNVKKLPLLLYGFFSVLLLYGGIVDTSGPLTYSQSVTWGTLLATYASGFGFNLIHASATVIFLLLLYEPVLSRLERIKIKYGILE